MGLGGKGWLGGETGHRCWSECQQGEQDQRALYGADLAITGLSTLEKTESFPGGSMGKEKKICPPMQKTQET